LAKFKQLKALGLINTKVTNLGVSQLNMALPTGFINEDAAKQLMPSHENPATPWRY
jgi:hypothetical protein